MGVYSAPPPCGVGGGGGGGAGSMHIYMALACSTLDCLELQRLNGFKARLSQKTAA